MSKNGNQIMLRKKCNFLSTINNLDINYNYKNIEQCLRDRF